MSRINWRVAGVLAVTSVAVCAGSFELVDDPKAGTLTVLEEGDKVLTYRYGPQLPEGVPSVYRRACYIHPLYSLDGRELTADFPKDHYHHRGVFWTWPRMKVGDRTVQTWHPSGLHQVFGRWLERTADSDQAVIRVENGWKLSDGAVAAVERLTITVHPEGDRGRAIDLELTLEALDEPIQLQGAVEKGYGGMCIRGAPLFTGAPLTTDQGSLQEDSLKEHFRWADMSTDTVGVALFVAPDHPDFPPGWLLRNSYAGILNAAWPGVEPYVLAPGKDLTLRYRLYVHRGDVDEGRVDEAYDRYVKK